jgi:hypothetical protein
MAAARQPDPRWPLSGLMIIGKRINHDCFRRAAQQSQPPFFLATSLLIPWMSQRQQQLTISALIWRPVDYEKVHAFLDLRRTGPGPHRVRAARRPHFDPLRRRRPRRRHEGQHPVRGRVERHSLVSSVEGGTTHRPRFLRLTARKNPGVFVGASRIFRLTSLFSFPPHKSELSTGAHRFRSKPRALLSFARRDSSEWVARPTRSMRREKEKVMAAARQPDRRWLLSGLMIIGKRINHECFRRAGQQNQPHSSWQPVCSFPGCHSANSN